MENTHLYQKKLLLHKNEKGNTLIFTLLIIAFILIPFSFYILEKMLIIETFKNIDRRIVVSGLAGLYKIDQTKTAYGEMDLDENQAKNTFIEYLKRNLELDNELKPINTNKNYGQITIKELEVYTNNELPARCSWNTDIQYPCIHVVIETNVKIRFLKAIYGDNLKIIIHRDVDLYTR